MKPTDRARGTSSRRVRMALVAAAAAALAAWLFGCGEDNPTAVGRDLRDPPDTLYVATLRDVVQDSVFAIPGTLGRSPVAQIGQQISYTAHALYAFRIPSRVFETVGTAIDTLFADDLHLLLKTDSLTAAPFTGVMRIGVREVEPGAARGWTRATFIDSVLAALPATEPDELAPDTLVAGAALANDVAELDFDLVTARIAGYDSARARGDSLDVNVVVRFLSFATPGRGFLELPLLDARGQRRGQLIAFSNERPVAIHTAAPVRSRPFVAFDATCPLSGRLAVSDGFRLHTYLRFAPLRRVVPDSALVFLAELVLTQADTMGCAGFGAGPELGVIVPPDTNRIFTDSTATRPIAFRTLLSAVPNTTVSVPVTPYIFDIQERNVTDRGMILRVSNEGTKARHFEFHGRSAADSLLRPQLRIVYGFPAGFEGGRR